MYRRVLEGVAMNSHDSDKKPASPAPEDRQNNASTDQANALSGDVENETVLDAKIQAAIGQTLKTYYDDLVNAPMPDRFMVLLAELSAKELKNEK